MIGRSHIRVMTEQDLDDFLGKIKVEKEKGNIMKKKVLLISLIGLVILFTMTYKAYSEGCGYYYSWNPSCPGDECFELANYWVEGTGAEECECKQPGGWDDCRTQTNFSSTCTTTWKLIDGCDEMEVESKTWADRCVSGPGTW